MSVETLLVESPAAPGRVWGATWVIHAPWAHPLWNGYVLMLYDLTTPTGQPAVLYREDVTHEFALCALDPEQDPYTEIVKGSWKPIMLTPPNHAYQFAAPSNEAARTRMANVVAMIDARALSPDTDYRAIWDRLFIDGVSLKGS